MTDTAALLVLIVVMAVAVVTMAVSVALTTYELRQTLRRVNALLPLLETTVQRACGMAADVLDGVDVVQARIRTFLGAGRGNGVRAEPHRTSRRRRESTGG